MSLWIIEITRLAKILPQQQILNYQNDGEDNDDNACDDDNESGDVNYNSNDDE